MSLELANTMKRLTSLPASSVTPAVAHGGIGAEAASRPACYDDVYFDSDDDSDDGSDGSPAKKRKHILSNDELLYDPDMDDRDQEWVDKQRNKYLCRGRSSSKSESKKATPESDAVLNCPACMTTLCFDCQRHEKYKNQYRAMFVFHCNVDFSEKLRFPKKKDKKEFMKNKRKSRQKKKVQEEEDEQKAGMQLSEDQNSLSQDFSQNPETVANDKVDITELASKDSDEIFYPVTCSICKTRVAVYDADEVYHFFNVITSY